MDENAAAETEHRFLVASAEEAVKTIREQLGENAQVVSVRRVERAGLKKLFGGAQLEVIARAPAAPGTVAKSLGMVAAGFDDMGLANEASIRPWELDEPLAAPTPPAHPGREMLQPQRDTPASSAARSPAPARGPVAPGFPAGAAAAGSGDASRLVALLRRGGLGDVLLARLQAQGEWPALERLPLSAALPRVVDALRREYAAAARTPIGERIAFVGMAGVGSTAMLCKHMARCVFSQGLPAAVYRLETGRPTQVHDLSATCELWGVQLLRSAEELPALREGTRLYVDVPGLIDAADESEEANIADQLEKLSITSRVFVLNAAYELPLLKGLSRRATRLGCRHVAFSHLDELVHWGKLWEFLLHRELTTSFYSVGAGVPGDFSDEVLELTLGKTFV